MRYEVQASSCGWQYTIFDGMEVIHISDYYGSKNQAEVAAIDATKRYENERKKDEI